MNGRVLSPCQQTLLDWLAGYWNDRGYGPTVREVQTHFGWRSVNGAAYHLRRLRDAGHVVWEPRQRRRIRPTKEVAT